MTSLSTRNFTYPLHDGQSLPGSFRSYFMTSRLFQVRNVHITLKTSFSVQTNTLPDILRVPTSSKRTVTPTWRYNTSIWYPVTNHWYPVADIWHPAAEPGIPVVRHERVRNAGGPAAGPDTGVRLGDLLPTPTHTPSQGIHRLQARITTPFRADSSIFILYWNIFLIFYSYCYVFSKILYTKLTQ